MNTPMTYQQMLDMGMHTAVTVKPGVYVMRVPGGWIYQIIDEALNVNTSCFVPAPEAVI